MTAREKADLAISNAITAVAEGREDSIVFVGGTAYAKRIMKKAIDAYEDNVFTDYLQKIIDDNDFAFEVKVAICLRKSYKYYRVA